MLTFFSNQNYLTNDFSYSSQSIKVSCAKNGSRDLEIESYIYGIKFISNIWQIIFSASSESIKVNCAPQNGSSDL